MKDNFDLKKFLCENKTLENSNPFLSEKNDPLRAKIREIILKELEDYQDFDEEGIDMGEEDLEDIFGGEYNIDNPDFDPLGDDEFYAGEDEDDLYEAKKDKEDVEDEENVESEDNIDVTDEEIPEEGGMDIPEMDGDEGEILNHLMKALGMAKSLGDEKLIKQIGNTVTFLTRQYISGE
jgi:hypothetical protein